MPSTRRRFLAGAAAIGTAAATAGCNALRDAADRRSPYSPGEDGDAEWPMPGYDRGSSGFNPDAAAPRDGATERWTVDIPRPSGPPVVAGGVVLVPTVAELLALDLDSGEELWTAGSGRPWPTGPAVHDGVAYLGFQDQSSLVAVDLADGGEVWRRETRDRVRAAPTFDGDFRNLYAGDGSGRVYQFDPASGAVVKTTDVFGEVSALSFFRSLLVGTRGGEVSDFFDDGDRFQGLWRRELGGAVTDLALDGGAVHAATFGGPVYRLQDGAHAGSSRWEFDPGGVHLAATPHDVFPADGGGIEALDGQTGERRWQRDGRFDARPAVAGDTVFAGDERGVMAFEASGGVRWTHDTDSRVAEGLAVADGAVFAVTAGSESAPSRAYALDPA